MADFLGAGWPSPLAFDKQRHIELAQADEAVRQSIWMILSTAPGERLMRPDFGCGIHDLVFAPINAGTVGRITGDVQRALTEWEPRIDVLDISVDTEPDQPNHLLIQISYRVRTTNNRFNLVYPFYLES
ncbi:GPW/gp25 family protein [Leptolyngbya sp. AN02str]|uniref:GPW/gp25 family protein n=1 Tax=Leptolyngbya sp. AN02str TaxID=3423363 RepID=UPI003D311E09